MASATAMRIGGELRRAALVGMAALCPAACECAAQEAPPGAPFGLSWGPVQMVPRPSVAIRDGNITALIYHADRAPPGLRDTDEVALEVCADEGLQEVIWISRPLAAAEARDAFQAAYAEGVRRYGTAEDDRAHGTASWPHARTTIVEVPADAGLSRILMVTDGPDFQACSEQHVRLTGHLASDHWKKLAQHRNQSR